MQLYVMRHGPAEDHAPSGRDFDRVLTREGRAVVLRAASLLGRALTGPLARLLTSPRARAHQTARLVHGALASPTAEVELQDALGGELAIPRARMDALARAGGDVLLVGHQPVVEDLVRALVHPAAPKLDGFRTATIVALEASLTGEAVHWSIRAVLDPHR